MTIGRLDSFIFVSCEVVAPMSGFRGVDFRKYCRNALLSNLQDNNTFEIP